MQFALNTRVTDLLFRDETSSKAVQSIQYMCVAASLVKLQFGRDDFVIVTLGSMTEASTLGSMDSAPLLKGKSGGAWVFWEKIAAGRPELWVVPPLSPITSTNPNGYRSPRLCAGSPFFRIVRDVTGNVPGKGGLITFAESNWLVSIVLPHQPHFLEQPGDVDVFWGYGLLVDRPGNFVNKPMSACNGREIMTEVSGHLQKESETQQVLKGSICIPSVMPFITSQFLPRVKGDRPQIVPSGWRNLAFTGQFCELADDVVFTIEYSVRSAQTAVYSLLGLQRQPPPVYKEPYDPRILHEAFKALRNTPVISTT